MIKIFPFVPLAVQLRVGVAIFSYDGVVSFGITGDYDGAPDIQVLADGIQAGMAELLSIDGSETIVDLRRSKRDPEMSKN
jgi:diacylglycerol O-acyltransferase